LPKPVGNNLGYSYSRGYAKTSYINKKETQDPLNLELALILALRKIRPPIEVLACQKNSVISLTGQIGKIFGHVILLC
jgi:hypothetical protein